MENETNQTTDVAAQIADNGVTEVKNTDHKIFLLTIIGHIEGHTVLPPQNKSTKYEHVIPQLIDIEEDKNIEGLLIILNTVGGDVEAGLCLSEMISGMRKPTVSLVLGGGHSIGVPLAVAAKYSFIAPSATMTIHPVRMNGVVIGAAQTYEYFNKVQEQVVKFVTRNSSVSANDFRKLMLETGEMANDVGTILFGEEAVKYGIINEVGGTADALRKLYELIEKEQ